MNKRNAIIELISTQGVLPLYFHSSATVSVGVLKALYTAGIRTVEYTNRGEEALKNFRLLKVTSEREMPDMVLGIGTIKNKKDAKAFLKAGADYIICPGMLEEVAEVVHEAGKLWVPGCMTTTEIMRAENAGAKLVKLFPGNLLGPGFVGSIKDLFPGLKFMPTGGVEVEMENLTSWFKSGVVAVGMGSKLVSKNIMEMENYTGLTNNTLFAIKLINEIRSQLN